MDVEVSPKDARELLPTPLLQQTTYWGDMKSRLGWEPLAFDIRHADQTGDVLLLRRAVSDDRCLLYAPHGPDIMPPQDESGLFLETLSQALRPYLDGRDAWIRYDLPWESPYARDPSLFEDGVFQGLPPPRIREMRMNFGTREGLLRKAPMDFNPPDTWLVNLSGSEADLLAAMKPKTRYNIGVAERKGVRVREASPDELGAWHEVYCETVKRNGMEWHGIEAFEVLFDVQEPTDATLRIWFAELGHELLAGVIVGFSGTRAIYLHGASSNQHRDCMPNYALQWHVMREARAHGCTTYDMHGIAPNDDPGHPFHGLWRFKTGFGGHALHREGTWDYPLQSDD